MKVLLTAINSKFIHSNLAVRYLKEYTRDLSYECKIREFTINDRIERVLEEIIFEKPDIVAFSCYIWNHQYIDMLSQLIKRVDSNIEILYGGPEVSYDCEQFLSSSYGEYLIEGEGEETYRQFIKMKLNEDKMKSISGLYIKQNDNIYYGGRRSDVDMNKLVFPYTIDDDLANKIVYYEASRGCPFKCKYCLSSTMHGVRFLDVQRVKRELKFLMDKKVRLVKFVDRTFNCSPKFACEIWNFIIDEDTETTFHFEVSADILKEEEIKVLSRATKGRIQLEVGVQTTNDQVLENIDRNVKFEEIKERVNAIKKIGTVKQHLDLIAGLPGENFNSFKNSFNDVYSVAPEEVQLGFLKLLKGSKMRDEAEEWGMSYSPFSPYEILKTRDISYEELIKLKRVEEMVDKYYNSQKFGTILKYFMKKFSTPFDFYFSLGEFFHRKGYFSRSIASYEYYRVFLEFNREVREIEDNNLYEIVKYDYLRFNKKKWLPEFLPRYIDKSVENTIKDMIKSNELYIVNKNYHVELFKLDITSFIKQGTINYGGKYYLIFEENMPDNIIDVTEKI
jgi:anaerobic magnesium-protoporphyrin IX monomethyl ester cyclase